MFELATKTKMTHVPFRSTAEVVNSMLGGNIELAIDSMTTVWPFAAAGNVRALAVTTPRRSAAAPDLPTIGETLKGYEATAWQGLFAPAGTARPIVDKIAAEVKQVWELDEVIAALKNVGAEPAPSTPDEFATYIAAERALGRGGQSVRRGTRLKRRAAPRAPRLIGERTDACARCGGRGCALTPPLPVEPPAGNDRGNAAGFPRRSPSCSRASCRRAACRTGSWSARC